MANEAKVSLVIQIKNLAKAELASFRQSLRNLGAEAKELLSSRLTQALSLGAIAIGLRKAFQATDELEQSQRTLAATAQLTGASLEELFGIANRLKDAFSIEDDQANKLTETITKLTVQAGRFNETQKAAAAFLELGAARGFTITETMEALESAQYGVYRGAQRLLGQNVEDLFQKQARAIGVSVGELTQAEKAQILLTAAIEAGETARGSFAAWLETAAGRTHVLNTKINDAQVALGKSVAPMRLLVLQGLGFLAEGLRRTVGGIQAWGLELGFAFHRIVALIKGSIGLSVHSVGELLNTTSDAIREWGGAVVRLLNPILRRLGQPIIDWAASASDKMGDSLVQLGLRLVTESFDMINAIKLAREDALAELGAEFDLGPNVPPAGAGGGKGKGVKPPPEDPLRGVKAQQLEMEKLRIAYRDGKLGLVEYGGELDKLRTKAIEAAKTTQVGSAEWAGYQQIIDSTTGSISGLADEFHKLGDAQRAAADGFDEASRATLDWSTIIGETAKQSLFEFGNVVEETFAALVDGSQKAGDALAKGMLQAIAAVVRGIGAQLLVQAGQWIAEGIANPLVAAHKFAAAAKAAATSALAFAVAGGLGGAASSIGGGGGGGGAGRGSMGAQSAQDVGGTIDRGPGVINIQGGLLDMTDPRQADALAAAIEQLTGRRVIITGER
ncbi:MAG TPA: hypothetical protein VGQ06_02195 [Gemmatimonadales bacterium]|jgi:hypothetical protein|nr:hypothetical protein [Gemmatimonadales bacterium]